MSEIKYMVTANAELPKNMEVKRIFSMVLSHTIIKVNDKNILKGLFSKSKSETDVAIQEFAAQAPSEANAIVGITMSTAPVAFDNNNYVCITLAGTPAVLATS